MRHPERKLLRKKKKELIKEEKLSKKNNLGILDLTPHNALKVMVDNDFNIAYK